MSSKVRKILAIKACALVSARCEHALQNSQDVENSSIIFCTILNDLRLARHLGGGGERDKTRKKKSGKKLHKINRL